MKIERRNREGYTDPMAYEATANIGEDENHRPLVYICSPYAGNVEANVEVAKKYCRFAVDKGYIPIAPHLLFPQFMDDKNLKEHKLGMSFGNVLMSKCSELWVCGGRVTRGMEEEIVNAKQKSLIIRPIIMDCEEETSHA